MCRQCAYKELEKINWPTKEELVEHLKTKSFRQLGRELGVSDNAIRTRLGLSKKEKTLHIGQ